ncbi:MAG TPA: MarR family transcriptional regulator [Symbiobacteriaceae bacterium]|nr:MarR family transcriptional regulator [Symbiobacteriaceae bacterium]
MQTVYSVAAGVLERRQALLQEERSLEQILSRRYDLTVSQFAALVAVEHDSKSLGQIADEMGVVSGNVTRLADALEEKELATRVISRDDRRHTLLNILPAGVTLLARIRGDALLLGGEG